MADYPEITTLAQLDAAKAYPDDGEVVNKIDDAIRQTRQWLVHFLGQSLGDTGRLKDDAIDVAAMLKDGVITADKLAAGTLTSAQLGVGSVKTDNIYAEAVTADKIANLTITSGKIGNAQVGEAQLAANAVVTAKIKDGEVTAAKIGTGQVGTDQLASFSGTKVADDTLPVKAIAGASGASTSAPKLPALAGSTNSIAATIGGVLSATLVGTELRFALASGSLVDTTGMAMVTESPGTAKISSALVGATVDTWHQRGGWTSSDTNIILPSSSEMRVKTAGNYLIHFRANGYDVGFHIAALADVTNPAAVETLIVSLPSYAGPSQQSSVEGWGLVELSENAKLKLFHWAEVTNDFNGRGIPAPAGSHAVTITNAMVEFIRI